MPIRPDLIELNCHPGTPANAVEAIRVFVDFSDDGGLRLDFYLLGDPDRLLIPHPKPSGFADDLWRHTCFEAFIGAAGETAYREFNFSPSGQWAAYVFRAYRERDESAPNLPPPRLSSRLTPEGLRLTAHTPPKALPQAERLQIGLSAVVEDLEGGLSYWALEYPSERPDFHHRAAFVLELGRAGDFQLP